MNTRARDRKAALVEKVIARVREELRGQDARLVERFARHYYEGVAPEDLIESSAENLYGAALGVWHFAKRRAPGKPKIRVFNPSYEEHGWQSTHTIVEIVNDDMPFLVDSTAAALNRLELTVHLRIHPILRVRRGAGGELVDLLDGEVGGGETRSESVLHVEVSQQSTPEALDAIEQELERVLADVRAAVEDWRPMLARLDETLEKLEASPPPVASAEIAEGRAFLEWIRDNHFTFLGYREYRLEQEGGHDFLRIVRDSGLGILRRVTAESEARHAKPLSRVVSGFARAKQLLIITKANSRATVHRPVYMDYIGIRRFDRRGNVIGEHRFLGLFTSAAYNSNPRDIPLLRRAVQTVMDRSGFPPNGHDAKALLNILETFPRDELFQTGVDELADISRGILHLEARQRIRLFVRRDKYARFFSCLVYVPRDRYSTELRQRMQGVLLNAFKGDAVDFTTQLWDAPMARVHFIVRTPSGGARSFGVEEVEARLVEAARTWVDDLRDALIERWGEAGGNALVHRYRVGFPAGYRDAFSARTAVSDIERIEALEGEDAIAINLYHRVEAADGLMYFKIFHPRQPVPLSDILPILENMGLRVINESSYDVSPEGFEGGIWVHDFTLASRRGDELDVAQVRSRFEDAFLKVWQGEAENDGFNQLVIGADLGWREVAVVRAYAKYRRQAEVAFSQRYVEEAVAANPQVARLLIDLFLARFDPARRRGADERLRALRQTIEEALDAVENLDEDRILRSFLNLVEATLRTSYFQIAPEGGPKPYLAFKLDSRALAELPEPRPMAEIFVYSPRVEGVHLRGGKVARGGIRWSDRREDFRTEVLGLMKAQMVKNAVIVPVGAKGGFVVKRPPVDGGREALMEEGIACYKTFISGLLDLTDNLVGAKVKPPPEVVRYDGDDPYLVVAADKGTATFSDIANEVARSYGFWLGDAFASGGSAGYDHKEIGITARGVWESVKRHFRELGVDIQTTDFTVVGIGGMSGDVFGNGMLLSRHIKLVGAVSHLHIFVDPDPDPATSYEERKRLFTLPRVSWNDYNPALISKGGGVFDRKAKAVKVTPEMGKLLGLKQDQVTPNELIKALLLAPVDLLWNGGIGTYVKAHDERHAEVGDRANDALRVDARDLQCRLVGEGGNLGFTQRGRIEYALNSGRINTDAIDNSAGVDCSDHEVNIKILVDDVVASGDMTRKRRDNLLQEMTAEVAELVLRDNYQQTQAITVADAQGPALIEAQGRLMRSLERGGHLDRALECLPDDETIAERQTAGQGLTRPEIAVLLAYAKTGIYDALLHSDLPEDPYLRGDLVRYFPGPLHKRFRERIARHRLEREIIATVVTNSMVNRVGTTFVHQLVEETALGASDIARAYAAARDAFALREVWAAIEALDTKVPTAVQTAMLLGVGRLVERATLWFLRNEAHPLDIAAAVESYKDGITSLSRKLEKVVSEGPRAGMEQTAAGFVEDGVPNDTARRVASLEPLAAALDIIQTARRTGLGVEEVGRIYFEVGARLGLDWLRVSAARLSAETPWQRLAVAALIDDVFLQQRRLAAGVIQANGGAAVGRAVGNWIATNRAAVERSDQLFADLRAAGSLDLAMLTVASRQIRILAQG
ncbi:MAG: NAD-glutamate dehydrogenase [Alphaproteobacteria bacterium]